LKRKVKYADKTGDGRERHRVLITRRQATVDKIIGELAF
jgi:hypothetical protein